MTIDKIASMDFYNTRTNDKTFTLNDSVQADEVLNVLGVDSSKLPDAYDVKVIKCVRVRKHKKKKIDKNGARDTDIN